MNTRLLKVFLALVGAVGITSKVEGQRFHPMFHPMFHMPAPAFHHVAPMAFPHVAPVRPAFVPRTTFVRPAHSAFVPRTTFVRPARPAFVPRTVRPAFPTFRTGFPTRAAGTTIGALPPGVVRGSLTTIPGFTPAQSYVNNLLSNPFFFNPFAFNPFAFNPFAFNPSFYPWLYDPFLYSYTPVYGYGFGLGYGAPGYSYGYGGGYGMYGDGNAYGNSYGGMSPYGVGSSSGFVNPYVTNPSYATPSVPSAAPSAVTGTADMLTSMGIPVRDGKIDWPLILRSLPGAEPLRKRIDGLYQVAADQASSGSMGPGLPLEMYRAVEKLQRLLAWDKHERMTFSTAMYEEGERFLRQLKQAARKIPTIARASPPASYVPSAASYRQSSP